MCSDSDVSDCWSPSVGAGVPTVETTVCCALLDCSDCDVSDCIPDPLESGHEAGDGGEFVCPGTCECGFAGGGSGRGCRGGCCADVLACHCWGGVFGCICWGRGSLLMRLLSPEKGQSLSE